jgi:isoamylase
MPSNLSASNLQLLEGREAPLGSLARDGGVNVAVFSAHATAIELCVYDDAGAHELQRWPLHGPHDGVWHGFLQGAGPGLVYGFRAQGPWAPSQGHRFNANKLLLDPCAREIIGQHQWRSEHHAATEAGLPDPRDNATWALKARVAPAPLPAPGWLNAPHHADHDLVIYELHVKGFSMQHPGIPPALRGTYSALAHPAAISHFKQLGVNALELLPIHYHLDEPFLSPKGLSNYWGYNTLGFFCPDPRFASHPQDPAAVNDEFRRMVATLHHHGIEVILDVVYNHTAEGDELGPSLSFRGLDHASWYRLEDDTGRSLNFSGCGNTLNTAHPRVTQFVLDSLRWWAKDMGVDGFRFDLAPVLGRQRHAFNPQAALLTAAAQDPVLARTRLIAEAWDCGPDGYQVGRFPGRWMEWNDRLRDCFRHFWLGMPASRGDFARRFAASDDLFHNGQRKPTTSINFIAAHDGFTLADMTSYASKHNQANGENNADGRNHEPCSALGDSEGLSADPQVQLRRERVRRSLMASLLLSQGTPMINAGDELLNSQQGNNNAWNQDSPIGWIDWVKADHNFADFVATLTALRRAEPLLHHARWFKPGEQAALHPNEPSMHWLGVDGRALNSSEWHDTRPQALVCRLDGPLAAGTQGHRLEAARGSSALLLIFNPEPDAVAVQLPVLTSHQAWSVALNTCPQAAPALNQQPQQINAPAHSLMVLRAQAAD